MFDSCHGGPLDGLRSGGFAHAGSGHETVGGWAADRRIGEPWTGGLIIPGQHTCSASPLVYASWFVVLQKKEAVQRGWG